MSLYLLKYVSTAKEAAWLCVTIILMQWHVYCRTQNFHTDRFFHRSLQVLITGKRGLANPKYFIKEWFYGVILYNTSLS